MESNILYWLWLQECLGATNRAKELITRYETAEKFYNAGEIVWKSEEFGAIVLDKMKKYSPNDFIQRLSFCREHKISILTPDSEYYPEALLEIENYPLALYVRGDYKIFKNKKNIAVIGSRTPCVYGEKAAVKITKRLVESNYLIVSGGALGIDSIAHKTAIENGGKTVLVLGCGHGSSYLPENAELRKAVASNGALISEYPPYTPVTKGSFQNRNRIISGMSKGVVIVEAAEKSGTFNTARHAKKQGRDLFVLPGDIESGNFAGSNKLLLQGAFPVFSGEDILFHYGEKVRFNSFKGEKTNEAFVEIDVDSDFSKKKSGKCEKNKSKRKTAETKNKNSEKNEKISLEGISKNALIVYNIMSNGICSLDEIKRESGLDISKVLVALTELELFSLAENDGPNTYCLK